MSQNQILSNRFVQVYLWLVTEGLVNPKDSKSMKVLAEIMGLEEHHDICLLAAMTKSPSITMIKRLCEHFHFNEEWAFQDLTNLIEGVSKASGNMIIVEDLEFFCGDGEVCKTKNFRRYNDPTFQGEHWVARAKNDSMEGTIFSGYYLYMKELDAPNFFRKGDIGCFVTSNKSITKRVKEKRYDKNGKLIKLILESDNKQKYPKEIIIRVNELIRFFKVIEYRSDNLDKQ